MFLPWQQQTLLKHDREIKNLLGFSFQPGNPETALNCPVLISTYKSLTHFTTCKVCQLLYALVKEHDPPIQFYEDYATLCFFCLHAPKTWTSTLATAADLTELLHLYFPTFLERQPLFHPQNLLGIDIQLHFFFLRCYKPVAQSQLISISNLNFLKLEFLMSRLTGSVAGTFCFKTVWHQPTCEKPPGHPGEPCCPFAKVNSACPPTDSRSLPPDIGAVFEHTPPNSAQGWLPLVLNIWRRADLLGDQNSTLCASWNQEPFFEYPDSGDHGQGPCLLSPALSLKSKNETSSICLLCECLASHPEAQSALAAVKRDILVSIENNVQLVDRISFLLACPASLQYISDPTLKNVIKGCSAQEIHKHLFCDPLCLLNEKITSPDILFSTPRPESLQKLKAALALGTHLCHNLFLDCEQIETLVTIFKSAQVCKIGKTTFLEVVRELDCLLKKHSLVAIQAYQTAQAYT